MEDKSRPKRAAAYIKLILLLLIIIGIPVFLYLNYGDTIMSKEWLSDLPELLRHYRGYSALILIGLQVLQVIICVIPGQPIQYVSSYLFGIIPGYLISIVGAVIGATAAFYIARLLGQDALHVIFGEEKVEDYRRKLNSGKGLMAVLLIYLIPGIPKDLAAYAAGISEMKFRPYIVVSTIGRTPGMLGSLLIGHFLGQKNYAATVAVSVVVALILIVCLVKRKELTGLLDGFEEKEEERDNGKETENR